MTSQLKNVKAYVEARFKKVTTTPTLNGKMQGIKFPKPKLYFIPFFDYGKELKCDLTNTFFSWILALCKSFFMPESTLFSFHKKFFSRNFLQNMPNVKAFAKNFVCFFGAPNFLLTEDSALKKTTV